MHSVISAHNRSALSPRVEGQKVKVCEEMSGTNSNAATPRQTALTCPGHTRPVVCLHFSGTTATGASYFISACKDGKPMLRQGDTGDWVGTYEGHKGAVWGACLNRDCSRAATGAADFTVKLWDAKTGDELKTFTHKHIVKVVDFSHDSSHLLSGCNDKTLRVFDLGRPDSAPQQLETCKSAIKSAVWTKEPGMLASCCEDNNITMWDSRSGEVAKSLVLESPATSIELSQDRELLTVAHGTRVTIINASSFEKIKAVSVPHCYSATLHPSGKWMVTGGEDFKLYKFDYEEEKEVESYKGHFGSVHCVRYSPNGEIYASGSEDGTIRLWQHIVGKSYGLWRSADEVATGRNHGNNNNSTVTVS